MKIGILQEKDVLKIGILQEKGLLKIGILQFILIKILVFQ